MEIKDIYYYAQGTFRYKIFYTTFAVLIREHIREQIVGRVASMDRKCFEDGQCKLCGCNTTALQMCNKACDKPCYPHMLTKKEWNSAKKIGLHVDKEGNIWLIEEEDKVHKFKLILS